MSGLETVVLDIIRPSTPSFTGGGGGEVGGTIKSHMVKDVKPLSRLLVSVEGLFVIKLAYMHLLLSE